MADFQVRCALTTVAEPDAKAGLPRLKHRISVHGLV